MLRVNLVFHFFYISFYFFLVGRGGGGILLTDKYLPFVDRLKDVK